MRSLKIQREPKGIRSKSAALLLVLIFSSTAWGQSLMFWGEAGLVKDKFGNGVANSGPIYGGGMSLIIGGKSTKSFAILVPVGLELRGGPNHTTDILGYGDLAFRTKNVSFGPGGNFGYLFRPDVTDPRCIAPPAGSSCLADGKRSIGTMYGFGISGFAKVTFGPQGRAFVQGRYIDYRPSLVVVKYPADFANEITGSNFARPTDIPDFRGGTDIRFSAGYVVKKTLLRVQYTIRQFDFNRVGANTNGIWNQTTRQITAGVGYSF
jgi:hypothetical protein